MSIHQEFSCEDELTAFTCFNALSAGSSLSILDELPDFEDDDDDDANGAPLPPPAPMPSLPAPTPLPSWAFVAAEPMDCRDAVRARYLAQVARANRTVGHLPRPSEPSAKRAEPALASANKSRALPENERKYVDHAATLPLWEGEMGALVIGLVAIAALVGVNASTAQFHIHRYHSLPAYRVPYRRGRWATAILKDDVPVLLDAIQTAKARADTARQRWRRGAVSAR